MSPEYHRTGAKIRDKAGRLAIVGEVAGAGLLGEILDEREQRIIEARYLPTQGLRLTLEELGREPGINLTRERVRQIEMEALGKLRTLVNNELLPMSKRKKQVMDCLSAEVLRVWHYEQSLPVQEIAAKLGCSYKTALFWMRVHNIRPRYLRMEPAEDIPIGGTVALRKPLLDYVINPTRFPNYRYEIDGMGLPTGIRNLLVRRLSWREKGISIREIDQMSNEDLLKFWGMGQGTLGVIREKLELFRQRVVLLAVIQAHLGDVGCFFRR